MKTMEEDKFIQLVLSLHSSAWIALGKVTNPLSGKIEKDPDVARNSIDILEMLKEKTRGNLNEEESKLIASCLADLQMNYVEEVQADKSDGEEKPSS